MAIRVLATIVLSSSVLNRVAIAEQMLDAIRASNPSGVYGIDSHSGADDGVPRSDEDWTFRIVSIEATSTLVIKPRPLVFPNATENE